MERRGTAKLLLAGIAAAAWMVSAIAQTDSGPPASTESKATAVLMTGVKGKTAKPKPEFPTFAEVSKDFKKISPADGPRSLYTIYSNAKTHQLLAEMHPGYVKQRIFIATSIAGGSLRTGWQWREQHAYWTRHDKTLVLMEPQLLRQARGGAKDEELKLAISRTYHDRVIASVPILTMGPGGGPVIDLDQLLVGNTTTFTGLKGDKRLAQIGGIKAFPQNLEIPVTIPMERGELTTLHYSISLMPKTGYTPRAADVRVGYFMTVFKDLTSISPDGQNFIRFVNRWNLEKRDANLTLSPPTRPIVFYIEHTVPVRYRRFVRDGILEWNKAFEKIGILNAIEVRQQDAKTGDFMNLAPEDVRYNFFRWISSERPFAMGPSRVNPETGEILDADIIFDDAMLKVYAIRYQRRIAAYGLDGLSPATLEWMAAHTAWDPMAQGHGTPPDRVVDSDLASEGLLTGVVQQSRLCTYAGGKAMQMQTAALALRLLPELGSLADGPPSAAGTLDGVPEAYLGGILKEIVMHEVGHTLGLRHNFRASAWLPLGDYVKTTGKANVGSVMDYNPVFVAVDPSQPRGDWVTPTLGPYDHWAIEYGYTLDESRLEALVKEVADPRYQYATDQDVYGPDPLVARFDLGAEPLEWARMRVDLVHAMRAKLPGHVVEEGQSWHLLRQAYGTLLSEQLGALRIAARYIGGVHVHRDHRGDADAREPLVPADADKQRSALAFVIEHAFHDNAFDLRPEVLSKLAADQYRHWGHPGDGDIAFSVHASIAQVQAFALLYLLNPVTLARVQDNELRVPRGSDALTIPEVLAAVVEDVYDEITNEFAGPFTNRTPMITSLRRNLQQATVDRLIDLAQLNRGNGRTVRSIARAHLRHLGLRLEALLERADDAGVDEYSLMHLTDLHNRIRTALEAIQIARGT